MGRPKERFRSLYRWCAVALTVLPQVGRAQADGLHVVRGLRGDSVIVSRGVIAALRGDTVRARPHRGPEVVYRAVPVSAVLAQAGSPLDSLRIGRTAWVVVAEAADDYRVVFSAAELEPGLGPTRAWLAYARADGPLSAEEGPYRLLVPTDTRPPRAAHRIVRLRVVAVGTGAR
ncbi:MAG: hypothetical protein JNL26_14760 [Gemmatimonadetes bacterium]|nr:hypothetical protein [Gemmatimonadota bacterium]